MNTTVTMDEVENEAALYPGAYLASLREEKGYTTEYVAGKLCLRVKVIELLEQDDYSNLPEPVFVKGYIRAYANLLEIDSMSLLSAFNCLVKTEKKSEKTLWQAQRETNKAENAVRWVTLAIAFGVIIAISLWWHQSKDSQNLYTNSTSDVSTTAQVDSEIRLTDLSKMRSIISAKTSLSLQEKSSDS